MSQLKCAYCSSSRRMRALIIGINDYADNKLYGAVRDALHVQEYVSKYLHVHEDCITMLTDQDATRKAILYNLGKLGRIEGWEKNDPILIYFAGHGTRDTVKDHSTECIVPFEGIKSDGSGPIPDSTIAYFLNFIAQKSGDNIVRVPLARSLRLL